MDINDIDSDLSNIKMPQRSPPGKRLDMKVKNAGFKIIILKAISFLFIAALLIFAILTMLNADKSGIDRTVLIAILFVLVAGGALVSMKLWSLDYAGWLFMLLICMAGVALPAFSAYSHGAIAIGTIPIIATSIIGLALLWYAKDVLGIKKLSDIFSPH